MMNFKDSDSVLYYWIQIHIIHHNLVSNVSMDEHFTWISTCEFIRRNPWVRASNYKTFRVLSLGKLHKILRIKFKFTFNKFPIHLNYMIVCWRMMFLVILLHFKISKVIQKHVILTLEWNFSLVIFIYLIDILKTLIRIFLIFI
jgi:hypothetical protein